MATKTAGQSINDLHTGIFATLCKVKPVGGLQARKGAAGAVSIYWRYSIGASSERVLIGLYDSAAPPKSLAPTSKGYSIAAASRAAEVLATEHHQHRDAGGRPALLAAQREVKRAAAEAKRRAATASLENLLTAYCDHLEAITAGRLNRLLINVPPGMMKSLLVSVFWPAWEWGPRGLPSLRYLASSYSENYVKRDSRRMRRVHGLLTSYPGADRFEFNVHEHDEHNYQLRFPNHTTGYCPALERQLTELLGEGTVEVHSL